MQLYFDRMGFPFVRLDRLSLSVSLLPVTKVQFERFIAQPNSFGDAWYEEILQINPRLSWRRPDAGRREGLFITGVLQSEAIAYASWAGTGFDLPSLKEWRLIFQSMTRARLAKNSLRGLEGEKVHPAARAIVELIVRQAQPRTWSELTLMEGGVIEWLRDGPVFGGFGKPRPQFLPNVFNPLYDDPRVPLHDDRSPYFGFRLVHRWSINAGGDKL